MSLKSRNKISADFSMSSLTDIIFLLLIFFMLTSTLVSPNALKLLLPKSNSQTLAKQSISVSITKELDYYIDKQKVSILEIKGILNKRVQGESDPTVILNAEKSVPVENVVDVMNIANELKIKMVLATSPKD